MDIQTHDDAYVAGGVAALEGKKPKSPSIGLPKGFSFLDGYEIVTTIIEEGKEEVNPRFQDNLDEFISRVEEEHGKKMEEW